MKVDHAHVWDLDGPALAFDALAVANRENLVFTHVHSNRRQPG